MIRTKKAVLLDPMTGFSDVVYFDINRFLVDERAEFNNQIGKVMFEVNILVKDSADEFHKILPKVKVAEYKLSTFLELYGNLSFTDFLAQKDTLAINDVAYNSAMYWGLKAVDLEVYTPQIL